MKIKVVSVLSFVLAGLCDLLVHYSRQSMARRRAAPCRSHKQPAKHSRLSTMMTSCPVLRRALPCSAVSPSSPPVATAAAVGPSYPPPCVCCPLLQARAGLCPLQPRWPQLLLAPSLQCPAARPPPRPTSFWPRLPWTSSAVDPVYRLCWLLENLFVFHAKENFVFRAKENFVSAVFLMSKELCWLLGELCFPRML